MARDFISVEADIKEVQKALSGTAKSLRSIQRQVLGTIARGAVKKIKGVINTSTKRQTGELRKAYGYKVKKDGSGVTVWPRDKAVRSNNHLILAKASVLSYGARIEPRAAMAGRKPFLQVSGRGYFARPKLVVIQPRNFIQAGQEYVEKGGYAAEIQKVIDRELKKYWS